MNVPYREAFPRWLTGGMLVFNWLLALAHFAVVLGLASWFVPSKVLSESWATAAAMAIGITAIPLVGLIAAYMKVHNNLDGLPDQLFRFSSATSIEWTLAIAVSSLFATLLILFQHYLRAPTEPDVVDEASWIAAAAAFAFVNVIAMFAAFIAISIGWDNCRRWVPDEGGAPDEAGNAGQPTTGQPTTGQPTAGQPAPARPQLSRDLEATRIGESASRREGVFPALVRCAHGPLGPRPRPHAPDSLAYSLGLLAMAGIGALALAVVSVIVRFARARR